MLKDIYKTKKETIRDKQWKFQFGKYNGWTLGDVMEHDPGYISFLQSKDIADFHSDIFDEIETTQVEVDFEREIRSAAYDLKKDYP